MRRSKKALLSWAMLALLSACGGGGGDDGGSPVLPVVATPLAITASNYQAVAQQTVTATTYLMDSTSLATGAEMAPRGRVLIGFARLQVDRLGAIFAARPAVATGVTTTETVGCSGGGSITATINDLNGNQAIDSGDSATMVAANCVELGATINGTIAIEFRTVTGDLNGPNYSATVVMSLSNLRASTGAGSATGNGSISMAITGSGPDAGTLDMTIGSLTMTGQIAGVNETLTLQDWRIVSTVSPTAGGVSTSSTVSGTLISASLTSQSITVATVTPFVQSDSDFYPSSGQFIANGASASKLRVTALNSTTVRIELDADGDNVYETSVNRLWSELG